MATRTRSSAPGISDAAVKARTGKGWAGWFATLDRAGAAQLPHREIAQILARRHRVPGWWSQMVTVEYERARGLRVRHQTTSGYSVAVSRTLPTRLPHLYAVTTQAGERPASRARVVPRPGRRPRHGPLVERCCLVRRRHPGRPRRRRPASRLSGAAAVRPRALPRSGRLRNPSAAGPPPVGQRIALGALALVLVVVAVVVVALTVGGSSGPTRSASPSTAAPAGPTFAPGTVQIIDRQAGISYPFLGAGWYEWNLTPLTETTATAGEYFTTQAVARRRRVHRRLRVRAAGRRLRLDRPASLQATAHTWPRASAPTTTRRPTT